MILSEQEKNRIRKLHRSHSVIKEQLPDKKTTGTEYMEASKFVQQHLKDNFQGQTVTLFMSDENGVEGEVVSTNNVMEEVVWWPAKDGGFVSIDLGTEVKLPMERDDYGRCRCDGGDIEWHELCCEGEAGEWEIVAQLVWSCGEKDFVGLPDIYGLDVADLLDSLPHFQVDSVRQKLEAMCSMPQVQLYLNPGKLVGNSTFSSLDTDPSTFA